MDEKIKTWTLRFPAKENPNMDKALFDWPIVLQYDVKAKYPLISRKFSGMKFFHPSVRLTKQIHARLYPFDKPVKSLYIRSFVCSLVFILRSYENRSNKSRNIAQKEIRIENGNYSKFFFFSFLFFLFYKIK